MLIGWARFFFSRSVLVVTFLRVGEGVGDEMVGVDTVPSLSGRVRKRIDQESYYNLFGKALNHCKHTWTLSKRRIT